MIKRLQVRALLWTGGLVLWLCHAPGVSAAQPENFVSRPAVFRVTTEVVNPNLEPFTVTMPAFGNTLKRDSQDGFEPVVFRTQVQAGRTSPDRIYSANPSGIHHYNSWGSGYLDGARVRLYRVEDGKLCLVREDRVPEGGTVIEAWNFNAHRVLPPDAREGWWGWAPWSRVGSTDWFTVFAVDREGRRTAAQAVSVKRPDEIKKSDRDVVDTCVEFRPSSDAPGTAPAPRELRAEVNEEGLVHLTWEADENAEVAGYIIAQSDTPPESQRGIYLQLADRPDDPEAFVHKGDLILLDKEFREFDRRLLSNRLGNLDRIIRDYYPGNIPNDFHPHEVPGKSWRLVDHPADTPVSEPGRTYLEMTLRAGDVEKVGKYNIPHISTTGQDYYPVPKPATYKMEVWLKADREDAPPVIFEFDGDRQVGGFLAPHALQAGTHWQKFEHTFEAAPTNRGGHAYFVLTCRGPATYAIDNFRVYRADVPYLAMLPEDEARYRDSGMAAIRTHSTIKTGETTYSMDGYTNPGGVVQGIPYGNTLPQLLAVMDKLGTRPWLQIEYHMRPEEWLGLIEYLAAPYDPNVDTPAGKPWAAKRYAQGRSAPWTEAFDRIYFELANETWNGLFAPWVFSDMPDEITGKTLPRGAVYGLMQDYVADLFRSSPYWNEELEQKLVHVMGGWAIGRYNEEIATHSQSADYLTIGAYNGGWDEGEGPPRKEPYSYFSVLSQANVTAVQRARQMAKTVAGLDRSDGHPLRTGTYEAGPGYAMNGLNNARVTKEQARAQEEVMKSKVAGTATLDSFLTYAYYGFSLQNFFTFGEGELWKSHAKWYRGGQAYPAFLALSLFNQEGAGDMLRTETLSTATVDYPKLRRRNELNNGPLAAVYATRRGSRVNVFCINRNYPGVLDADDDGYMKFALDLPFTRAGRITRYALSGEPADHNLEANTVQLVRQEIAPETLSREGRFVLNETTGAYEKGLPPAALFLYVFESTNITEQGAEYSIAELLSTPIGFVEQ